MPLRLLKIWRQHFLWCELVLSVLVGATVVVWGEAGGGWASIDQLLHGQRSALYGAFASIAGSLLGFVLATVSIVIGFASGPRMKRVRQSKHYPTLWRVFTSAIRVLGMATCVFLAGLVLDKDDDPSHLVLYGCIFVSVLAVLRVIRCIWVLEKVIALVVTQQEESQGSGP